MSELYEKDEDANLFELEQQIFSFKLDDMTTDLLDLKTKLSQFRTKGGKICDDLIVRKVFTKLSTEYIDLEMKLRNEAEFKDKNDHIVKKVFEALLSRAAALKLKKMDLKSSGCTNEERVFKAAEDKVSKVQEKTHVYISRDEIKAAKETVCHGCNEVGHIIFDCTVKCHNCGEAGHSYNTCNLCRYCREEGHNVKDCPKLKKKDKPRPKKKHYYVTKSSTATEASKEKREPEHLKTNYALSEDMFYCLIQRLSNKLQTNPQYDNFIRFILDGGASRHCCRDKEWFTSLNTLEKPRFIRGMFKEVQVKQEGSVVLCIQDKPVTLKNVLYIPEMLDPLIISSGKLRDNGWVVDEGNKNACVRKGDTVINISRDPNNGLFVESATEGRKESCNLVHTSDPLVWHRRLGHCSLETINRMIKNGTIKGIPHLSSKEIGFCTGCAGAKQTRKTIHKSTETAQVNVTEVLEKVHMDTFHKDEGLYGFRYAVLIVDDHTKYMWIKCAKTKSEIKQKVIDWCKQTQRVLEKKIKVLRTDNGTEFINEIVLGYTCSRMKHVKSPAGLPQLNGAVERAIRTVKETMDAFLMEAGMSSYYWPFAAKYSVYVWNRVARKHEKTVLTPFELVFRRRPNVRHLYTFGAHGYAIPGISQPGEGRTRPAVFLGVNEESRTYFIRWKDTNSIGQVRDAQFDDYSVINKHQIPKQSTGLFQVTQLPNRTTYSDEISETDDSNNKTDEEGGSVDSTETNFHTVEEGFEAEEETEVNSVQTEEENSGNNTEGEKSENNTEESLNEQRNNLVQPDYSEVSTRNIVNTKRDRTKFYSFLQDRISKMEDQNKKSEQKDPKSFYQIIGRNDEQLWRESYNKELRNFERIAECEVMDLKHVPSGQRVLPLKEVFLTKRDGVRKTRFCMRGDLIPNIDPYTVFAHTTSQTAVRLFFVLAIMKKTPIRRGDIKNAFLNSRTGHFTYFWLPKGHDVNVEQEKLPLIDRKQFVWKTPAAVYGDPRAPSTWLDKICSLFRKFGMYQSRYEPTIFTSEDLFVVIFVDDFVYTGSEIVMNRFEKFIQDHNLEGDFNLPLNDFLGFEFTKAKDQVFLSQTKYITKAMNLFTVPERKITTPLAETLNIKDLQTDDTKVDKTRYQGLMGTLNFLSLGSRPDVTFAVSLLARFQAQPNLVTMKCAERVLQYLHTTRQYKLPLSTIQPKDQQNKLVLFVDASWDNLPKSKSTHGFIIYFNKVPVVWRSKAQTTVALSATEAEYIGLCSATKELFAVYNTLRDWKVNVNTPMQIFCDNMAALHIGKERTSNKRVRHLDRQFFFVQDKYKSKQIELNYVNTRDNTADMLTKALGRLKLTLHRKTVLQKVEEGVGVTV